MPIQEDIGKKWSGFTWEMVEAVPDAFGVYEIAGSSGEVIYIGSGILGERLRSHKSGDNSCIKKYGRFFRYEQLSGEERTRARERNLMSLYENRGLWPRCNKRRGFS